VSLKGLGGQKVGSQPDVMQGRTSPKRMQKRRRGNPQIAGHALSRTKGKAKVKRSQPQVQEGGGKEKRKGEGASRNMVRRSIEGGAHKKNKSKGLCLIVGGGRAS